MENEIATLIAKLKKPTPKKKPSPKKATVKKHRHKWTHDMCDCPFCIGEHDTCGDCELGKEPREITFMDGRTMKLKTVKQLYKLIKES